MSSHRPCRELVRAKRLLTCAVAVLVGLPIAGASPPGTAFTYQGRLLQDGTPVTETCDFLFGLWDGDCDAGGQPIGPIVEVYDVQPDDGLFTVEVDFGPDLFKGTDRWLLIAVRSPAGAGQFTPLTPCQQITPAPLALTLPGLWTQQNETSPNLIGGWESNSVAPDVVGATIGGGGDEAFGPNFVGNDFGTVAGGIDNEAGNAGAVGGGFGNAANGVGYATVGGGFANVAGGYTTTVGGGGANEAIGDFSTVPGGRFNLATGFNSLAAGQWSRANFQGMFVWADVQDWDLDWDGFPSAYDYANASLLDPAANQFLARATGGVAFVTAIASEIGSDGEATAGAWLAPGSGTWSALSDRHAKENIVVVDTREVLLGVVSLPVTTWNYKSQRPEIRHMGPMARDFHAAFGIGENERFITTLDADGVALAAIQGLYGIVEDKDAEISELKARLSALEMLVERMAARQDGGAK